MKRVLGVSLLALVLCTSAACVNAPAAHQREQARPGQPGPAESTERSTTLIAIDTAGLAKTEDLFSWHDELTATGMSPDGRYVLFFGSPTDEAVRPYLLDRNGNQLHPGKRLQMKPGLVSWSGHGFWIDTLVHLDLTLQVNTCPQLRQALGLNADTQLVAASVSADGSRVAALVGPARIGLTDRTFSLDLILARADGTGVVRVAKAVQPWFTQNGPRGLIALSPDGSQLAIAAESPGPRPLWAPDGQHAWMPGVGIVMQDGTVAAIAKGWGLAWRPDGSGILLAPPDGGYALAAVRGAVNNLGIPKGVRPIGYLPDGRLLAVRNAYRPPQDQSSPTLQLRVRGAPGPAEIVDVKGDVVVIRQGLGYVGYNYKTDEVSPLTEKEATAGSQAPGPRSQAEVELQPDCEHSRRWKDHLLGKPKVEGIC